MTRVTIKQAREILANKGLKLPKMRNKHGNIKKTWIGIWRGVEVTLKFDSIKEMNRGIELITMERTGLISELEFKKRYLLQEKLKDERAMHYTPDSFYKDNEIGRFVVEDVKSEDTIKKTDYIMRRKLMKFKYPYLVFREK